MTRFSNNLFVIVVTAIAGTALLIWLANSFTFVQAILGLLVVLVFPGYALIELLMGRRTLGTAQHLFMMLSSSLAIAILGGLVLNQLPVGVRLDGWIALFVSPIIGAGLLAWLLRHRRSAAVIAQRVPVRFTQLLLIGIAIALAGGALLLAHTPTASSNYAGYTMLWMIPAQAESPNHLQLGIDSKEFAPTQYKLELLVNEQIVHEWSMIELIPNQQWQANLAVNLAENNLSDATGAIEANLYRLDQPTTIYRHVVLRPQVVMKR